MCFGNIISTFACPRFLRGKTEPGFQAQPFLSLVPNHLSGHRAVYLFLPQNLTQNRFLEKQRFPVTCEIRSHRMLELGRAPYPPTA